MRRVRRSSFSGEVSETGGGTAVVGFDHKRRTELLAEARRKRVAWVEEARGVEEGIHGARRRREDEAAENERKAESELERVSNACYVRQKHKRGQAIHLYHTNDVQTLFLSVSCMLCVIPCWYLPCVRRSLITEQRVYHTACSIRR